MTADYIPGASLRAWKEYFPNAIVYGADIDKSVLFMEDRIETGFLDQLNTQSIRDYWETMKTDRFDLMIDDGLHTFKSSINLFTNSIQNLKADGVYIIEDVRQSDLVKFCRFFKGAEYSFSVIAVKRRNHPLGDNILISINQK